MIKYTKGQLDLLKNFETYYQTIRLTKGRLDQLNDD